ncbi:MAG: CHAT domain-containing protein [Elainellaceae cyanobacterium]
MQISINLSLTGNFHQGFYVSSDIRQYGQQARRGCYGYLQQNMKLLKSFNTWQENYQRLMALGLSRDLNSNQIRILGVYHDFSPEETKNKLIGQVLHLSLEVETLLKDWLLHDNFNHINNYIEESLPSYPAECDIKVSICSNETLIQRLPWHAWSIIHKYPNSEVVFNHASYERIKRNIVRTGNKIRILSIIGNDEGIDTEKDKELISKLPDDEAEVEFLNQPTHSDINKFLSQKSWDILFFSGHSKTEDEGIIHINKKDKISLNQLEEALGKSINKGLQLAIFNSCDGIGLAQMMNKLHIPQVIVMRESVPDKVAQCFLKFFLDSFSRGNPLHVAVRHAKTQLQCIETEFPCASWLPSIFQIPEESSLTWEKLKFSRGGSFLQKDLLSGFQVMTPKRVKVENTISIDGSTQGQVWFGGTIWSAKFYNQPDVEYSNHEIKKGEFALAIARKELSILVIPEDCELQQHFQELSRNQKGKRSSRIDYILLSFILGACLGFYVIASNENQPMKKVLISVLASLACGATSCVLPHKVNPTNQNKCFH